MKVIGAGFGRTGTMSLKVALEQLGFGPCYHMTEVFAHPEHAEFWVSAWRGEQVDWDGVLGDYEATLDWPACTFYEVLMERHPDAKVLLSVRDPERWYESVRNTIYELSVVVPRHPLYRIGYTLVSLIVFRRSGGINLVDDIIWQGTFDGRFEDKAYAMEVFSRHNAAVQLRVPTDRLLVYDVKTGWGPLCDFLGVEEPDEPFPRTNDTAQMRRRLRGVKAISIAVPANLTLSIAAAFVLLLRRRA
ncbi:sulfotransferase family protein [soil metagenome]